MITKRGFLKTVNTAEGESKIFDSATSRDTFWSANKLLLKANDSYCFTTINGVLTLQQWTGATSPVTYDNANWVLGLRRVKKERGQASRTGGVATNLAVIGTRYKIDGIFAAGPVNSKWTIAADGRSTYDGEGDAFDLDGVSDAESSRVAKVTYVLFKNGVELPETQSPHNFSTAQSSETLAITGSLYVDNADFYDVYAFSDTANTVLTPNTLTTKFVN